MVLSLKFVNHKADIILENSKDYTVYIYKANQKRHEFSNYYFYVGYDFTDVLKEASKDLLSVYFINFERMPRCFQNQLLNQVKVLKSSKG